MRLFQRPNSILPILELKVIMMTMENRGNPDEK